MIDFDKIKKIVTTSEQLTENVEQNLITRDKTNWTVHTKTCRKKYRLVYDKRVILDDLSTIPFGYKY